jgi:hypothetical protein
MLKILEMFFPKRSLPKLVCENHAESVRRDLAEHVEMYAAAFLKETNLKPSECELIVEQDHTGFRYEFRKKTVGSCKCTPQ